MLVSEFDYHLPEALIAQEPSARRDRSRLLVVDRASGEITDSVFEQLPRYLKAGDLLVVNNTRVFPARLIGHKVKPDASGKSVAGGRVEVFLVRRLEPLVWEALVKPGRSLQVGARVEFGSCELMGEVIERHEMGRRVIRFTAHGDFDEIIDRIGRTPLPPYIKRDEETRLDSERYQTVYARERGAIAAPTAGLHFTPDLFDHLREKGIEKAEITLHVGYGTFQPVRVERVEDHHVEAEAYTISEQAAAKINRAIDEGRRVIAVGTTTTRALESASRQGSGGRGQDSGVRSPKSEVRRQEAGGRRQETGGDLNKTPVREQSDNAGSALNPDPRPLIPAHPLTPATATTELFIYPGFEFQIISGLITNFHLPRSSLLMLVSAFAGRDLILRAYRHAVESEYRFYSYGDATLIL